MDHQLEVGFHSLADLMIEIMYEKTKQDSSLNNKPVSPITGGKVFLEFFLTEQKLNQIRMQRKE